MKRFAACIGIMFLAAFPPLSLHAQSDSPVARLFGQLNERKDDFARFRYLISAEVQDDSELREISAQMLATSYSFLGRPSDALRSFPMRGGSLDPAGLPARARFRAVPASGWVAGEATGYRIVMVNEAHHVPQTRLLTLSLLPELRAAGYTHFAVETLSEAAQGGPGHPNTATGVYTREPIFAEIIREALRLGYVLVAYEPEHTGEQTQQQRETGQAQNIMERVLARDPAARVLVHAGYAHIGESAQGLPDDARPMAMELARLTGLPILSVDQTSTMPYVLDQAGTAHGWLSAEFDVAVPSVLIDPATQSAWSHKPGLYDVTVVLPKSLPEQTRPAWLALGGRRQPLAIDASACLSRLPCLVEARYRDEPDEAIPADQFVLLEPQDAGAPLYLAHGAYRLRLIGNDGAILREDGLDVPAAAAAPHSAGKAGGSP